MSSSSSVPHHSRAAPPRPSPLPSKKQYQDDEKPTLPYWRHALLFPSPWKTLLGITVTLYVLNQSHMLPRQLSGIVSRALFWPTLPITVVRRMGLKGHWMDQIDDTVIMGGAPFGFLNFPDELYRRGVRGVVNLCQEYRGPRWKYDTLGMTELWLPTTDHFEPSLQQLQDAVNFIQSYAHRGERVYVHCRAGHGRSAAAVLAWMTIKSRGKMSLQELNQALCRKRMVRRTLWKQPNMRAFYRYVYGRSDKFEDQVDESMTDTESDQDEAPQDTTSRGEL